MSNLTWAKNESDDHALSMKELSDSFLKIKTNYQAEYGKPLKAVKLSRLTLLTIPLAVPTVPLQEPSSSLTFYGVPIEIDNSLALWEFKEVYA